MVERVDEWQGGCAIESPPVIQGSSNADRGLIDIRDAEIDLPHDGQRAPTREAKGVPW
jgi:hypothetical protein